MYLRFNEDWVSRVSENLKCSVYKFLAAVTNATGPFLGFVDAMDSLLELLKPLDEGISYANYCGATVNDTANLDQFCISSWQAILERIPQG